MLTLTDLCVLEVRRLSDAAFKTLSIKQLSVTLARYQRLQLLDTLSLLQSI